LILAVAYQDFVDAGLEILEIDPAGPRRLAVGRLRRASTDRNS